MLIIISCLIYFYTPLTGKHEEDQRKERDSQGNLLLLYLMKYIFGWFRVDFNAM